MFLKQSPLHEVEPSSTFGNCLSNKKITRHAHFRACYTRQRFVQQNCEASCKKTCLVKQRLYASQFTNPIGRFNRMGQSTRYKLSADFFFSVDVASVQVGLIKKNLLHCHRFFINRCPIFIRSLILFVKLSQIILLIGEISDRREVGLLHMSIVFTHPYNVPFRSIYAPLRQQLTAIHSSRPKGVSVKKWVISSRFEISACKS